ncbi:hypothetical protein WMF37_27110 [Sorangium sp. So ce291]|uniref:hypothetical protein n=1 Tax=Sorangium sp. So ce291 TaxID=3133294 RepID=UPI003F5DE058
MAAASFITLSSAPASAKDHADWALEFVNGAVSNELADVSEPCSMAWDEPGIVEINDEPVRVEPWTGKTRGACLFVESLKQARGYGYEGQEFKNMWGKYGPSSAELFDVVNRSAALGASAGIETYFRRVAKAADIQKGDVFVIDATATYSGHTAIITGPATEITPQIAPRYSGTRQYAVPIVDSTSTAHGCLDPDSPYADSRWSGACTGGYMKGGAGTATMRVYTDSLTGILLGYTWSVTASTTSYYSPMTRPYRVGRPYKLIAPVSTDPPPPPP